MTQSRSATRQNAQLQLSGSGSHNSCSWPIDRPMTIGRESEDIQLPISTLSRQHARVIPTPAGYEIIDLDSQNGTAVNGELLNGQPHPLYNGDTILLAGQIEMIFQDPNATPRIPRLGTVNGLWIDPISQDVWIDAQCVSPALSGKQFELLALINDAKGGIVSRDEISRRLWPKATHGCISNDAIDSLIKRLRRRLRTLDNGRQIIELVRGRGIRLVLKRDILKCS